MFRYCKTALAYGYHLSQLALSRGFRAISLTGVLPGTETPINVLYLGARAQMAAINDYFFDGNAHTKEHGSAHAFLQNRARRRFTAPETDAIVTSRVPGAKPAGAGEYVTAALRVNLALPTKMEQLVAKLPETERRKVRQALKAGFEVELGKDERDYREFHTDMLAPLMTRRYGAKAWIVPVEKLLSQAGRSTLLFLKDGGKRIGGVHILWPGVAGSHSIPHFNKIGMIDAVSSDPQQLNKLNFALYYQMFNATIERGYSGISLGIVPPLLNNGLFWFKARWGSDFVAGAHEFDFYRHTIAFCSAKAQEIQQRRYLVHIEEGKLSATMGVKPSEAGTAEFESMVKSRQFPSLSRVHLRFPDGKVETRPGGTA